MPQAYASDMRQSARRHLEAGERLYQSARNDVAGYIFGIAAECAFKQLMLASGMRPLPPDRRRDDPFFAHFEELKALALDRATGRLSMEIRRFAEAPGFMQHWDVSMRYSHGRDIDPRWIDRWHDNARDIIAKMEEV